MKSPADLSGLLAVEECAEGDGSFDAYVLELRSLGQPPVMSWACTGLGVSAAEVTPLILGTADRSDYPRNSSQVSSQA